MVDKVVIIGAGDHGRGTLEILREARRRGSGYDVLGFLDDAPEKHGVQIGGLPVLGALNWIDSEHPPDIGYVIAVADPRIKQKVADALSELSLTFISAIHPSANIASGVRVAPGVVLNAGVAIAFDTLISEHATVNLNATIGHDCMLGRFSTVAPGANIAGNVQVGEGCSVGLNATVGLGLVLGEWSSIGPGAVVIRQVPSGQHVFGNPARSVPRSTQPPSLRAKGSFESRKLATEA